VGLRRHLKKTRVVTAKVTGIDHAGRTATITPEMGEPWQETYDQIVVTAGAVSRTFPIPGGHRRQRDRSEDDRRGSRDP